MEFSHFSKIIELFRPKIKDPATAQLCNFQHRRLKGRQRKWKTETPNTTESAERWIAELRPGLNDESVLVIIKVIISSNIVNISKVALAS